MGSPRHEVVDVPGPSPTALNEDGRTLDTTTTTRMPNLTFPSPERGPSPPPMIFPSPDDLTPTFTDGASSFPTSAFSRFDPAISRPAGQTGLSTLREYDVAPGYSYVPEYSYVPGYNYVARSDIGPGDNYDPGIVRDSHDPHVTGEHDERNLALNWADLCSTGICSTADWVECGSTSPDPSSLYTAYDQGHDPPTTSTSGRRPMLPVEEDLIGIGDGLAQSPVVGTASEGGSILWQEDNHPLWGVLPGSWRNNEEQDVPLANINAPRAVGSAHGASSPDKLGRLLPENATGNLQSSRHIIRPCAGAQTDGAEENDGAESAITTDESLSFALISEDGDSQATEDPTQTTPAYELLKRVLRRLVVEFHGTSNTSACTGSSSVDITAKGTGPPNATLSSSAISARCKDKRRSSGAPGDKDDDDDEERPPNKKSKNQESPAPPRSTFLACPFWKSDPNTHFGCYGKKLRAISYVKQHLRRNHTPAYYCQVCFTILKRADTLDDHVMATPRCTRGSTARLDGISREQTIKLKTGAKGSVEQQWFAIWDILFPEDRRPLSIHIDQSEDFASFHEFIQHQGVQVVRDELAASGIVSVSGDEEGRPLDRAIERALEGLFERFRSDRLSYSVTSRMLQTAGQHTEPATQDEAMVASSTTDSGVGVSSVFSSGGSGAGDEAPHQPTSIANPFARPPSQSSGQPQALGTIGQAGATDEMFRWCFNETGETGFAGDLFDMDGEGRLLWDDFVRECNK